MKKSGVMKWYNANKGYGFINEIGEGVQDIFVHYTAIPESMRNEDLTGKHLSFDLVTGPKGGQAFEVEILK